VRAICFDFGNVIGFFDHFKAFAKLAPYTAWSSRRIYDEIYSGQLEDDLESGRLSVDDFLAEMMRRTEMTCDVDFVKAACADIFTPNPEVCELIPRLAKRYRIVLGSNTSGLHSVQFRKQFADVLGHFHAEVLSCEAGVRKPKAGFFERCAAEAGCALGECVFIDDLPANIAGATAAGMRGLVYRPNENLAATLDAIAASR
jgi:putative hydrolase of the HAD superfamily